RINQFVVDLDEPWGGQFKVQQYDAAFALDVLEHLKSPEQGLAEIFKYLRRDGKLYASTGNVAFLPLRLALFLGWFNYGRCGILELTHRRLFTVDSFRRLLKNAGFRIDRVIGFGPPLSELSGKDSQVIEIADRILAWLARRWPKLFAYQILIECTRTDSPDDLIQQTFPNTKVGAQSSPDPTDKFPAQV
ncbi:MAG: methyltransferase domain-containing protein, partial [Blastocatellia bacterium]|nr:methyltransferase domain-containing protein [Blastocatellia bacterium]